MTQSPSGDTSVTPTRTPAPNPRVTLHGMVQA
jgi:hypothetical protein